MTPYIKHLVLKTCVTSTYKEWLNFFSNLPHCCPCLQHLEVHHKQWDDSHVLLVRDHVEPLFSLPIKSLAFFSLGVAWLQLSDKDHCELAGAWPNLKYLDLFATGQYTYPKNPTLQSVITVMSLCTHIEHLRISVWNRVVDLSMSLPLPRSLDAGYPPFYFDI